MIINKIHLDNWNQIEEVNIQFHPRLTVLTGANGAGKSSILRIIGKFIGWHFNETSIPNGTIRKYRIKKSQELLNGMEKIGSISIENTPLINLLVPETTQSATYGMTFINEHGHHFQPNIKGINIPSHRTAYIYKPIVSIPARPLSRQEAFNKVNESYKARTINTGYSETPSYHMKETLVGLAVFGEGNSHVEGHQEAYQLFLGFIDILKKLLPATLGFKTLSISNGEVVLVTETGNFLLDTVSGGIGAIIDLAWQIHMYDSNGESFVVLIDEAENHLHASMQRRILPSLVEAFPKVQFIISTHSPLVVNSVKDSAVYVLYYNEDRRVESQQLDLINKAADASKVLRDVLGVPITMPIWVEEKLNLILENYQGQTLTVETYIILKQQLAEIGLADHLPQALSILQGGYQL